MGLLSHVQRLAALVREVYCVHDEVIRLVDYHDLNYTQA